jgi:hypothetical protein
LQFQSLQQTGHNFASSDLAVPELATQSSHVLDLQQVYGSVFSLRRPQPIFVANHPFSSTTLLARNTAVSPELLVRVTDLQLQAIVRLGVSPPCFLTRARNGVHCV